MDVLDGIRQGFVVTDVLVQPLSCNKSDNRSFTMHRLNPDSRGENYDTADDKAFTVKTARFDDFLDTGPTLCSFHAVWVTGDLYCRCCYIRSSKHHVSHDTCKIIFHDCVLFSCENSKGPKSSAAVNHTVDSGGKKRALSSTRASTHDALRSIELPRIDFPIPDVLNKSHPENDLSLTSARERHSILDARDVGENTPSFNLCNVISIIIETRDHRIKISSNCDAVGSFYRHNITFSRATNGEFIVYFTGLIAYSTGT